MNSTSFSIFKEKMDKQLGSFPSYRQVALSVNICLSKAANLAANLGSECAKECLEFTSKYFKDWLFAPKDQVCMVK